MPVIKARNKLANKNTGGNKKQGLVPSMGKSRLMRHTQLSRAGANDKTVYCINQLGGIGRNRSMFKVGDSAGCVPHKIRIKDYEEVVQNDTNEALELYSDTNEASALAAVASVALPPAPKSTAKRGINRVVNNSLKIGLGVLNDRYYKESYIYLINKSGYRFEGFSLDINFIINNDVSNFVNVEIKEGLGGLVKYPEYISDKNNFSYNLLRMVWNSEYKSIGTSTTDDIFYKATGFDNMNGELVLNLDTTRQEEIFVPASNLLYTTEKTNEGIPVIDNYISSNTNKVIDTKINTSIGYVAHKDLLAICSIYHLDKKIKEIHYDRHISLSIYSYRVV